MRATIYGVGRDLCKASLDGKKNGKSQSGKKKKRKGKLYSLAALRE